MVLMAPIPVALDSAWVQYSIARSLCGIVILIPANPDRVTTVHKMMQIVFWYPQREIPRVETLGGECGVVDQRAVTVCYGISNHAKNLGIVSDVFGSDRASAFLSS